MTTHSPAAAKTFAIVIVLGLVLALVPVQGNAQSPPPPGPPPPSPTAVPNSVKIGLGQVPIGSSGEHLGALWGVTFSPGDAIRLPESVTRGDLKARWQDSLEGLKKAKRRSQDAQAGVASAARQLSRRQDGLKRRIDRGSDERSIELGESKVNKAEDELREELGDARDAAEHLDAAYRTERADRSAFVASGGDASSAGGGKLFGTGIDGAASVLFGEIDIPPRLLPGTGNAGLPEIESVIPQLAQPLPPKVEPRKVAP